MKIIITGIGSLGNRGVEALFVTTVKQLRLRWPDLAIDLFGAPTYEEPKLHSYGVNLIPAHLLHQYSPGRIRRFRSKFDPFFKSHLLPGYQTFMEMISDATLVVASGGDNFGSDYGPDALHWHLRPLRLALGIGKPIVMLAQSIGPFKTDEEANAWLKVARNSKLITVREKLSHDYVTKELGLSTNLVKHTADSAFLLEPPPRDTVRKMLNYYGIMEDRPIVAISASQGISHYTGSEKDRHYDAWCQVINMILNELDSQVLLIPHVEDVKPRNDDRIMALSLLEKMDFNPRVRLAGAVHSASELKGLISMCDMVIAERMHASIAGLSSGVCTLPVGYSVKARGIMTDLLGPEATQNGLLIPFQEFLNAQAACAMIRAVWSQRHEVADRLKAVIPRAKKDAERNFDMLSQVLAKI